MDSCQGNRSPERGHYSGNQFRSGCRQAYRRNPSMPVTPAQTFQPNRIDVAHHEDHCDNGARMSDSACNIAYLNDALYGKPLAMAYVPWQRFQNTCDLKKAFQIGTIFPELNDPFLIGRCTACR